MINPLLETKTHISFSTIHPKHFKPTIEHEITNYKCTLAKVLTNKLIDWTNSIQPLEEAYSKLSNIWNIISHLNSIKNTNTIRKAYKNILPIVTKFHSENIQQTRLFEIFKKIYESKKYSTLKQSQQTIIKHTLRDFKLAGIELPKSKKKYYQTIKHQLSNLSNQFSNNVLDATQKWEYHIIKSKQAKLTGLPKQTKQHAKKIANKKKKTGWILTIEFPCYSSVLTHSKDKELRKVFYEAYTTRASDQGPNSSKWDNTNNIKAILKLRHELAQLVGYQNFSDYSIATKMASNTEDVINFLQDLIKKTKNTALSELERLSSFAKATDNINKLNSWDIPYYSELYKKKYHQISHEALRPYFPENQVFAGIFKLIRQLFGLQIKEINKFDKWHSSIKLFSVKDQSGMLKGQFYTDLYTRNHKMEGAWMADALSRIRFSNGQLQNPIAFLTTNFTQPTKGKPALLSHNEIIILFHEFGHVLHHILTKIDYISVSGINGVAWDTVELASQFMENWCWEWEVIKTIAKHYETQESLSKSEFNKLLTTKNFQTAMHTINQLELALFDFRLHLHDKADRKKSPQEILNDVRKKVSMHKVATFNRQQNCFSHIFDGSYAAGYYSYKWAEVLSSDVFEKFKENGTINSNIGKLFLSTILEHGGSQETIDLFIAFRGRKPRIEVLLKHAGIIKKTNVII